MLSDAIIIIGMLLGSPFLVQSSPRTIIRHVLSTRTCVNFLFLRVTLSRAITSILIDGSPGRAKISRNWVIHTSIDRVSQLTLFCQEVILWTLFRIVLTVSFLMKIINTLWLISPTPSATACMWTSAFHWSYQYSNEVLAEALSQETGFGSLDSWQCCEVWTDTAGAHIPFFVCVC